MRSTSSLRIVVLTVLILGLATISIASDNNYKIIVNPKNPITTIDRGFLRDAYLKKSTEWGHGGTIRPVDLSTRTAVRDRFTQEVLKKTPAQLRSYWNQQIFSGKGVPPVDAETTSDLIAYVLANPGAVGYLPMDVDPGGTKVISSK